MLVELGTRNSNFVGWGVDSSAAMCEKARGRVASHGLDHRITIVQGDAFDAGSIAALPRSEVRSITATSVLNELWGPRRGQPSVATWLRSMAEMFPGCALVVTDYFGRLGHVPPPWRPGTGLHDLLQVLSDQGVPPPDHGGWHEAYRDAGAVLLHMVEDESGRSSSTSSGCPITPDRRHSLGSPSTPPADRFTAARHGRADERPPDPRGHHPKKCGNPGRLSGEAHGSRTKGVEPRNLLKRRADCFSRTDSEQHVLVAETSRRRGAHSRAEPPAPQGFGVTRSRRTTSTRQGGTGCPSGRSFG